MKYVYHPGTEKTYRFPTHTTNLVVDRADCATSEVFMVVLSPGEAPPLHQHEDTEQIFFVIEGKGLLTIGSPGEHHEVSAGDVVRIPPKTLHSIQCHPGQTLRYLAIDCFVHGVPAAEPTWDKHIRVVCEENGWDYDKVV